MLRNKTNLQKNKSTTSANMQPHHPKLDDKLLIFHGSQPSEIEKKVIVANMVVEKFQNTSINSHLSCGRERSIQA